MAEKLKLKIAQLQQQIHGLEALLAEAKAQIATSAKPAKKPKAAKPRAMTTRRRKSADD